jgi:2,4-dienoyl-CoA reductase-like NADH-dependent reductase (Old Yellow Enzyme family)
MKKIFESVRLGNLAIKNRLVRSATFEFGCNGEGAITPAINEVFEELAKGEIGLIVTGMMCINRKAGSGIEIFGDTFGEKFSAIAKTVHKLDSKIVVQLGHMGVKALLSDKDAPPVGPSDIEAPHCKPAKGMTKEQIREHIKDYGIAALRCKEAGADGVQFHGAHGYLMSEFLSPYFNKRTDEYGGSVENRARFLFEAYDEIRARVGKTYPVLIKINYSDLVEPGISGADCVWVCGELAKRGMDGIEVSAGAGFGAASTPCQKGFVNEGFFGDYALDVASKISAPVISTGGFRTPEAIEAWLNKGNISAIALSRPLIREPALAKRWKDGDLSKALCISCSKCFSSPRHGCYIDKYAK